MLATGQPNHRTGCQRADSRRWRERIGRRVLNPDEFQICHFVSCDLVVAGANDNGKATIEALRWQGQIQLFAVVDSEFHQVPATIWQRCGCHMLGSPELPPRVFAFGHFERDPIAARAGFGGRQFARHGDDDVLSFRQWFEVGGRVSFVELADGMKFKQKPVWEN